MADIFAFVTPLLLIAVTMFATSVTADKSIVCAVILLAKWSIIVIFAMPVTFATGKFALLKALT